MQQRRTRKALQINPQLPDAETRLIYIYGRLGQFAKPSSISVRQYGSTLRKWDAYFN